MSFSSSENATRLGCMHVLLKSSILYSATKIKIKSNINMHRCWYVDECRPTSTPWSKATSNVFFYLSMVFRFLASPRVKTYLGGPQPLTSKLEWSYWSMVFPWHWLEGSASNLLLVHLWYLCCAIYSMLLSRGLRTLTLLWLSLRDFAERNEAIYRYCGCTISRASKPYCTATASFTVIKSIYWFIFLISSQWIEVWDSDCLVPADFPPRF